MSGIKSLETRLMSLYGGGRYRDMVVCKNECVANC